jgi:hypothetical protein
MLNCYSIVDEDGIEVIEADSTAAKADAVEITKNRNDPSSW